MFPFTFSFLLGSQKERQPFNCFHKVLLYTDNLIVAMSAFSPNNILRLIWLDRKEENTNVGSGWRWPTMKKLGGGTFFVCNTRLLIFSLFFFLTCKMDFIISVALLCVFFALYFCFPFCLSKILDAYFFAVHLLIQHKGLLFISLRPKIIVIFVS